ncbi:MAG: T9SS type A sorting domain-containing protein [Rhodothermales bacterium]
MPLRTALTICILAYCAPGTAFSQTPPDPVEARVSGDHSVARLWNEALLQSIREDFARPTVHARNLFHTSAVMWDAWAAYDTQAQPWLLGRTVAGFTCPFTGIPVSSTPDADRRKAISHAAYTVLSHRFAKSPGRVNAALRYADLMAELGYDPGDVSMDYGSGNPAALGNYIGDCMIRFGLQDGANEEGGYANRYYRPANPAFNPELPGNPWLIAPNNWQPLSFDLFIDQSGNPIPASTPEFVGPEWGEVVPFALSADDLTLHVRGGYEYHMYHDPGPPPRLSGDGLDAESMAYKWGFALVAVWSGHLDPADGVFWETSPASIGNQRTLPTDIRDYPAFYDLTGGGDPSKGHILNDVTGQPYEAQLVPRGDYARVLAEFWADGPDSETPPGHWFTILNEVSDHPELVKRIGGEGPVVDDLEWDVKAYLTLGGTLHDVAVAVWGIKGWYDYVRPVSAIRWMAGNGQSSDPDGPSYSPYGLPLVPDYIDVVLEGDPLAGPDGEHIGKIKINGWRGPEHIADPERDEAGTGWILAENWWPYQRPTFITPPFAGYVSGHSTFSRAAAEVMTLLTGDDHFPGGMGVFPTPWREFLVFEDGPSVDMELQWATYRDASDQCSLSRIWGGIHPPADDIPGRLIGIEIGVESWARAQQYINPVATHVRDPFAVLPEEATVHVYPNPVPEGGWLRVDASRPLARVSVIDALGRRMTAAGTSADGRVRLETAAWPAGVYLVVAETDDGQRTVRPITVR